LTADFNQRIA